MSETLLIFILIIAFGCIRVALEIVHTYLKRRWRKELIDFKVANEVISIYRKHKENKIKNGWIEKFKRRCIDYFNKRKQMRKDRKKYGI